MLTLLPPIGKLDISGGPRRNSCDMKETSDEEKPTDDALFAVEPQLRPQRSKTSPIDNYGEIARPSTSHSGLATEGRLDDESLTNQSVTTEEPNSDFVVTKKNKWTNLNEISVNVDDMVTVNNPGREEKISDQRETTCERAAETQPDYEQDQPQKLSFEHELTFIPKLNALSLKIAQSRSSVAKRIKVSVENRVAALEEEMAQTFTFRPCISENSVKIADRLKTDFWTRQKLHTEKQRRMLETVSSNWHPKAKTNPVSKQPELSLHDKNMNEKAMGTPFSEPIHSSATWMADMKKGTNENTPYPKTNGKFFHKPKKIAFQEIPPKRLESLKPRALKKLEQRKVKSDKIHRSLDDTVIHFKQHSISEPSSPSKYISQTVSNSNDFSGLQKTNSQTEKGYKCKSIHKRSKTMPMNNMQIINRPLVVDPDRFLKTKSSAEEALKNKRIFICMGPYPVLRACLRRRGWIEKNFKADIVCSKLAKGRSPDKYSHDSDDDDDNDDVGEEERDESELERTESPKEESQKDDDNDACHEKTAPTKYTKSPRCRYVEHASSDKKVVERTSRYAYGSSTVGNFEDLDRGFESDSQYGIMSRIARNAVPTLIWTCRRSDIEFNYLNKDQIVNHFVHASSFTTKFGICINIRNVPFFESVDPDSFFPRCHRLSSEYERQDFIDEFRMLSAIAILRHTMMVLSGNNKLIVNNSTGTSIPTSALLLAMKACRGYMSSKQHFDIEEGQKLALYGLSEEKWNELVEFFYQLTRDNNVIVGAEPYKNDCEKLLIQMEETYPQCSLHEKNVWIIKPGAKSRGRGILVMDNLQEILKLASGNSQIIKRENKWVVQKYIERPLLIYNTKFDIRQWFLVTDWNPFTLWFYKSLLHTALGVLHPFADCYLRFCSQEFTLSKFDPEYHLANNSIQKDYKNGPRSKYLPTDNMWTKDQYVSYLREHGHGEYWDDVIYPSMKQSIIYTLLACQDSLEYRKNSFELYGADFMMSEDMRPWLIEINCSPAMGASTAITEKLCAEVIEDTLKVVLDRRENKSCGTGKFELAYKQQYIPIPVYTGSNLLVEGERCKKPVKYSTPIHYNTIHTPRSGTTKDVKDNSESNAKKANNAKKVVNESCAKKVDVQFLSPRVEKKLPEKVGSGQNDNRNSVSSERMLKKEMKQLLAKGKKEISWKACVCETTGNKCNVVSAYHVKNASLDVSDDCYKSFRVEDERNTPKKLSSRTLKLARMHRKTKKKTAYATLKYRRSSDGPGLSIEPGRGVSQM